MRQATSHSGEVRESDLVLISNYSKPSQKTWEGKGYVYGMFTWSSWSIYRCWKVRSDFQITSSRFRVSESAFLVEAGKWETSTQYDKPSMRDSISAYRRGRSHDGCLDIIYTQQRVGWINTLRTSVATGTTLLRRVLVTRIGTTIHGIRTTTSGLGASVTIIFYRLVTATASLADQYLWSADLSSFGKYIAGFGTAFGSVKRRLQPTFL